MNLFKRNADLKIKSEIYDILYDEASAIINKYKPCSIDKGKCMDGECCCRGCEHLKSKGCSVKALACRLYLCMNARRKHPHVNKQLKIIENIASKLNLIACRASKEEILQRMERD